MNRSTGRHESLIMPRALLKRVGTIELIVAIQTLSPALLMISFMQPLRMPIRAVQYGSNLLLLLFYSRRSGRHGWAPGSKLLALSLLLLLVNLLHPTAQLLSGVAQFIFQACIAAPLLWAAVMVRDPERLKRLLWAVLLANTISAGFGLLQVFYPAQFLPSEFSPAFRENLQMLTYEGSGGRQIMRPPGLTDVPGGAAPAGLLCGLLGLILATNSGERFSARVLALLCCLLGLTILYLTFVRSLTLALLASFLAVSLLRNRHAPKLGLAKIGLLATGVVLGSFLLATAIGGDAVSDRFLAIPEGGLIQSYQSQRGIFVSYTINEVLPQYPFGAGAGRWGMMCNYFCDATDVQRAPLWAEIQPTGWIYDGGIPLALAYLGALIMALWYSYRITTRHRNAHVAAMARSILAIQICLAISTLGGPTFNSQLGAQFWLLGGALFGTCLGYERAHHAATAGALPWHASQGGAWDGAPQPLTPRSGG